VWRRAGGNFMLRPAVHLRKKADDLREVKVLELGSSAFFVVCISPGSHAGEQLQEKRFGIEENKENLLFISYFALGRERERGYTISLEQTASRISVNETFSCFLKPIIYN